MIPQAELRAAFTHAIEAGGNKVTSIDVVCLEDNAGPIGWRADFDLPDTTGHDMHALIELAYMRPLPMFLQSWPDTMDGWAPLLAVIRNTPIRRP
jgi:hypothetical protein